MPESRSRVFIELAGDFSAGATPPFMLAVNVEIEGRVCDEVTTGAVCRLGLTSSQGRCAIEASIVCKSAVCRDQSYTISFQCFSCKAVTESSCKVQMPLIAWTREVAPGGRLNKTTREPLWYASGGVESPRPRVGLTRERRDGLSVAVRGRKRQAPRCRSRRRILLPCCRL